MSNVGVHDFAIPHEHVRPPRDLAIIRMPYPPKKSAAGTIIIPDMFRDMAQHNTIAGRIVAKGPLAFSYKDANGKVVFEEANIGDWVVIRPYAGTTLQGGKISAMFGWRYISTFQDAIGVLAADKMPDPASLLWDDEELEKPKAVPTPNNVRETIKGVPVKDVPAGIMENYRS